MKKWGAIGSFVAVFIVIYFLQVNFFSWFNIGGIKPNLFVLFVLTIGLFTDRKATIITALLSGFILDINNAKIIGVSSIMLIIIGIIAEIYNKNFSKDSRITFMLMGAISTFIYEIGWYLLNAMHLSIQLEVISFLKVVLTEIVFNTLITIILHQYIQMYGAFLEKNYKGQRVLTEYF